MVCIDFNGRNLSRSVICSFFLHPLGVKIAYHFIKSFVILFGLGVFQTCDIKAEGKKRFLSLKNVQLDQAGEVSYQALNAVTSAMLTVKGMSGINLILLFSSFCCLLQAAASVGLGNRGVAEPVR